MLIVWQSTILVGQGVSLQPPVKAKTKGRTIPATEEREVRLGAKGPKKNTRACHICKIACGHNAATCPQLQHNKVRLESLRAPRSRGRPPGAKNKVKAANPIENTKETTGPRRRGRPPGAKNKVRSISTAAHREDNDAEEDPSPRLKRRRLVHFDVMDE